MERCKTFKPFLLDIINIVEPNRINIELQEIPITFQQPMNFRRKKFQKIENPWRMICLNPIKTNYKLDPFIEMLSNERLFQKRIRKIGIVCLEGSLQINNKHAPINHYVFGQYVSLYSKKKINKTEQLSYVSIWDLEFKTKNLRNTKTLLSARYKEYATRLRGHNDDANDLPF